MDLELVAGPELVQRPVNLCFDEQGVMYVTESSGSSGSGASSGQESKESSA